MSKPATLSPRQSWSAWADRAIGRSREDAARCARFIDGLDPKHPDLKGLAPEDRADISRRLHDASKGR